MAMPRFLAPFGASRTPTRWGDPFLDLQRGMNRVFEDVFRGVGGAARGGEAGEEAGEEPGAVAAPRIDIDESERAIRISAELPGVTRDELDLSLEGESLTLRGEKRCERRDERACVSERFYGSFRRTIQLPFAADAERVEARFENGVLTITLPKPEQAGRARRIAVNAGAGAGSPAGDGGATPA